MMSLRKMGFRDPFLWYMLNCWATVGNAMLALLRCCGEGEEGGGGVTK
jgi:hypothetical protein